MGSSNFFGFLRNLSEYGADVKVAPSKIPIEFYPETKVELKFQLPSGPTLNLHGEVRWFRIIENTVSHDFISYVGIEILKPPSRYRKFVQTL
jgi:hypothetical protein